MAAMTTTQRASWRIHPRIRVVGRIALSLSAAHRNFIHLKVVVRNRIHLEF
jgi:hypothetical protein